jgi:hypothetical protein
MNRKITRLLIAGALFAAPLGAACDIDQTRDGELPEVEVTEGQMPEYDVDTPEVTFGTRTEQMEVPDIDIHTETEEVEVPTVAVEMPDDDDEGPRAER